MEYFFILKTMNKIIRVYKKKPDYLNLHLVKISKYVFEIVPRRILIYIFII
jgi:hypothetical protein